MVIKQTITMVLILFVASSGMGAEFGYAQIEWKRLTGLPSTKASCDSGGCSHEKMKPETQNDYMMILTNDNGKLHWTSRNNLLLKHTRSGQYDDFVADNGQGYIRVSRFKGPSELEIAKQMGENQEGGCYYTEHLTNLLRSVTYWGECYKS